MVHLSSATLNSLADVFRRLQPVYAECSSVISNLADACQSRPVESTRWSTPGSAEPPTYPATPRVRPAVRQRSAADHSSREPFSVPERSMAKYDRERLYRDVWSLPLWKAAKKNGMNEDTLSAVCRRLHIPTPGPGYWSRIAAGKATEPKPLLPAVNVKPSVAPCSVPTSPEHRAEASSPWAPAPQTDHHSSLLSGLNARYSRNRLYELVWKIPMRTLALQYGVSDSALRKACCRLLVPLPPQGYWNKVAAGKQVAQRPALPPLQMTEVGAQRRAYTAEERSAVLTQIARDIAAGQTLAAACRQAGILEKTYRRWYRQQPALAPLDVYPITPRLSVDQAASGSSTMKSWPKVSRKLLCTHDREKLHGEVWSTTISLLAEQYGVSESTIWERCRKLHIPLPAQGHWRRLRSGLPVQQRTPLPEIQIIDESEREWKSNLYSLPEIASISQRISDAISNGKTLEDACRETGIAVTTYRRWRKRLPVKTA